MLYGGIEGWEMKEAEILNNRREGLGVTAINGILSRGLRAFIGFHLLDPKVYNYQEAATAGIMISLSSFLVYSVQWMEV